MLGLALAIALGIVIAVVILAALPTIIELTAKVLGSLVVLALAYLLLLVLARVLGIGCSVLGRVGPWLALLISLVAWGVTARQAMLQMVGVLRSGPGEVGGGWIVGSVLVSFVTLYPLYLMEEGSDPILQTPDSSLPLRLVVVSPVLISFAILVAAAVVESAKRGAEIMKRARAEKGKRSKNV